MEAIIFALVLTWVIRYAAQHGHLHWQGSKAANRDSTRGKSIPKRAASAVHHDIGYWAHQVLNGFPEVRRGLANGWHKGRTAQQQGAAERQRRKAEHLETRARLIPEIREHRRRQAQAWEEIYGGRDPGPAAPEGEAVKPSGGSEGTPEGTSPGTSLPPEAAGEQACARCAGPLPPGHYDDTCPACRTRAHEAGTGEETPPEREEETPPDAPGQQEPPAQPGQTEGDGNMSETTYQGVKSQMDTAETEAEQYAAEAEQSETVTEEHTEQARQAKERGTAAAEEMQSMDVDAETLSATADYLQALDDAEKHAGELNDQVKQLKEAWQRVQETAAQVKSQLDASGHGALDEAHANAAGGGAQKPFYGEGG